MSSIKVSIQFDGLDRVLANLQEIDEKTADGVKNITKRLGEEGLEVMQRSTHVRSGKLRGGDELDPGEMGFTLFNEVRYAPFVESGHKTPRGWRTKRGFRPAKRQHWVEARPFLAPAVDYIEQNILDRLATVFE